MAAQRFGPVTVRPAGYRDRVASDVAVHTANPDTVAVAVALLQAGPVAVLTGAGMSTDSGIPDYRSPGRPPHRPMTHSEFCSGSQARQRYWARSHLGWRLIAGAAPNAGHRALAGLERAGRIGTVITQNVDGLHAAAGSRRVIDLHGRIDEVVCLACGQVTARVELAERMARANPGFGAGLALGIRPDGDVELNDTSSFRVPDCRRCTGTLKPRVVFFGDSVAKPLVATCFSLVDEAGSLLVVGSSLTVMSGLRFVRHAARRGIPVVIVNRGPTRGDDLATVKLDTGCSETLAALGDLLGPVGPGPVRLG